MGHTAWRRIARATLAAVTRRYPLYRGQYRLSHSRPMLALTAADEVVVARLKDRSRIVLPVNDMVGRTVFWCGDHDPRISWVCARVLRPGDTCIDIGANVGAVALRAARLVGPAGVVHAVEPQAELADLLTRSARANAFAQLRVHALALSDTDGEASLYLPVPPNRGSATLDPAIRTNQYATAVSLRHAGRFLETHCPGGARLAKIDIENHEEPVLRAMAAWLDRHRPDAILFESFFDSARPFWSRPVVRQLAGHGYRFFRLPRVLLRMRLDPIERGREPPATGWDFLAVHSGADTTLRRLGR